MPAVRWGCKFGPDPEDPRYVKVTGEYTETFLNWSRRFGKPAWNLRGEPCIQKGVWIREPAIIPGEAGPGEKAAATIRDKGLHCYFLIPLAVLEPWFLWQPKEVTLFDINGNARTKWL